MAHLSSIKEVLSFKLLMYSGVQNISVENVNSSNDSRVDTYRTIIKHCFPYIDSEKHETKAKNDSTDDLVEKYKKMMDEFGMSTNLKK